MIRFLVLLSFFIFSVHGLSQSLRDEMREKMQIYGMECAESEKVSEEDLENLFARKPPVTHEGKCVLFCAAKKFNMMHEDGSFGEGDVEWLAKAKADDPEFYAKLTDGYTECKKNVEDSDSCEKAFKVALCAIKQAKENGLSDYLY